MKAWTDIETKTLKEHWKSTEKSKLLQLFPYRTWKSLKRKSESIGLTRTHNSYHKCEQLPSNIDWIIGEVLGDGHINKYGRYSHTTKYEEYAKFLHHKFSENKIPSKFWKNITYDKRTNKNYTRYLFNTPCVLKSMRNEWYSNGTKIVPSNLQITPEILFHWFMGDGSISENQFRLHTQGFNCYSVKILQTSLFDIGINCSIHKNNNLYINRNSKNSKSILSITNFNFPKCYNYKLEKLKNWLS